MEVNIVRSDEPKELNNQDVWWVIQLESLVTKITMKIVLERKNSELNNKISKKEILTHAAMWVNLEDIVLSKNTAPKRQVPLC